MIIVCCNCKRVTGTKECQPELNGHITHGLCSACYKVEMEKVDRLIQSNKNKQEAK